MPRDWEQCLVLLKTPPSTYEAAWSFGGMGKVSKGWERLCHLTILIHHDCKEFKKKNKKRKEKKEVACSQKSAALLSLWVLHGEVQDSSACSHFTWAQIPFSSRVRWLGRQFLYTICKVSSTNWNYTVNGICPRGIQSQCTELKGWLAESFKP